MREQAVENPADHSLKAKAVSIDHLLTHFPKNPYCSACQRAKVQNKPAMRQGPPDEEDRPKDFGDQVTADHVIVAQGGNPSKLAQRERMQMKHTNPCSTSRDPELWSARSTQIAPPS